jgi:hypothetical protein
MSLNSTSNLGISYYFCLMIEGSGSGSIPLTNGSGSGSRRHKNIRIRIRIRIRNTAFGCKNIDIYSLAGGGEQHARPLRSDRGHAGLGDGEAAGDDQGDHPHLHPQVLIPAPTNCSKSSTFFYTGVMILQ